MAKRDANDNFDPFGDDDMSFDELVQGSGDNEADDDVAQMNLDDDDMFALDEDDDRPRGRRTARRDDDSELDDDSSGGGGIAVGSAIRTALIVVFTGILATVIFLAVGGGLVFGARQVRILEGGPVNLNLGVLSDIIPTQPSIPTMIAQVATDIPASAAPTTEALPAGTQAPTATATPVCDPEAAQDWWGLQQASYAQFTSITPSSVSEERNPAAYLERLRITREFAANIPSDDCTALARTALLALYDAARARATALINFPGTPETALADAELAYNAANAELTSALWRAQIVSDENSPVALNIEQGSGSLCGASAWLRQVEPIYAEFLDNADQVDVVAQPPNTIRTLITTMEALRGNAEIITTTPCAQVPAQILLDAMNARLTTVSSQLQGDAAAMLAAQADYTRLDGLYRAWVLWLMG